MKFMQITEPRHVGIPLRCRAGIASVLYRGGDASNLHHEGETRCPGPAIRLDKIREMTWWLYLEKALVK